MGFIVIRERIQDNSVQYLQGFSPSRVGQTARSKTFKTLAQAEREARAWIDSGDFTATIEATGDDALANAGEWSHDSANPFRDGLEQA